VKSPNPQFSDVDVPLVSSFILSSKKGKEAYVEPIVDGNGYRFEVRVGKPPAEAEMGTKLGRGAKFKCVMSGTPMEEPYVREAGANRRMGARLMAIVAEGARGRVYLAPTDFQEAAAAEAKPCWRPTTKMAENPRWFSPPAYGMTTYGDIFTDRQLVALNTFSDLVKDAQARATADAKAAGWADDGKPLCEGGTGATAYGDALAVYLTFGVDRLSDLTNSLCSWSSSASQTVHLFGRQAIPMAWDYAENNKR
jgi:putative DNA methylase